MKISNEDNFLRVFRIPNIFSGEYCFNGGIPTNFQMVDWFHAISHEDEDKDIDWEKQKLILRKFIASKIYINQYHRYLVLTNFGETFIVVQRDKDLEIDYES